MNRKLLLSTTLTIALTACSNFQPSPSIRGVSFPLRHCTTETLEQARKELTIDQSLEFSDEWVCVAQESVDANPSHKQDAAGTHSENQASGSPTTLHNKAPSNLSSAESLRVALEGPFTGYNGRQRPEFGIALAGGGSKASSFAIGVMAGLADANLLDNANYISSVSGGSYAAYFYYTHRIYPSQRSGQRPKVSSRDLFRDCVRIPQYFIAPTSLRDQILAFGGCYTGRLTPGSWKDTDPPPFNQHQAFLRCQQDVLSPGICSTQTTLKDSGISGLGLIGSVTLFPFSNIANTLFDWGYGVSISQRTYRSGIGLAYGSSLTDPRQLQAAENGKSLEIRCSPLTKPMASDCHSSSFTHRCPPESAALDPSCDAERLLSTPDGHAFSFQELRAGLLQSKHSGSPLPFWIINAAAPKYRSLFGWLSFDIDDPTNSDMFEMTAISHGSPRFGYVSTPVSLHNMNVLDAVVASAAFFDSNQLAYGQPARGILGIGQHLLNFDWGADIPNYNVSDSRRSFHKTMPLPFYFLDSLHTELQSNTLSDEDRTRSAFIRLIDGGNAENLGAYALLRRRVKTILISDAAADSNGEFEDICGLARRMQHIPVQQAQSTSTRSASWRLYIPGLANFEEHCQKRRAGEASYYNIRAWNFDFPVLMGCLRLRPANPVSEPCRDLGPHDSRLLIVKPALDLERFVRTQVLPPTKSNKHRTLIACQLPDSSPNNWPRPLNCDSSVFLLANWSDSNSACPVFPQHSTAGITMNSSYNLFGAYRELARQYVHDAAALVAELTSKTEEELSGIERFEKIAAAQAQRPLRTSHLKCGETDAPQPPSPV